MNSLASRDIEMASRTKDDKSMQTKLAIAACIIGLAMALQSSGTLAQNEGYSSATTWTQSAPGEPGHDLRTGIAEPAVRAPAIARSGACQPAADVSEICSIASGRDKFFVCADADVPPKPRPDCMRMGDHNHWCCR